jgi:hypothetical protein
MRLALLARDRRHQDEALLTATIRERERDEQEQTDALRRKLREALKKKQQERWTRAQARMAESRQVSVQLKRAKATIRNAREDGICDNRKDNGAKCKGLAQHVLRGQNVCGPCYQRALRKAFESKFLLEGSSAFAPAPRTLAAPAPTLLIDDEAEEVSDGEVAREEEEAAALMDDEDDVDDDPMEEDEALDVD